MPPGSPAADERIVRVVPDVPAIHRRFDYRVPAALEAEIEVGSRVRVELHGRRVAAWVVEDDVGLTPGISPKPLVASSGQGPPASVVDLAEWAAWRWAGPVSSFLGTASPSRVVRGTRPSSPTDPFPAGGGSDPAGADGAVASPGGGSVSLVDAALASDTGPAVVRLAPALDATLLVLELIHRTGPAGVVVLAPSHGRAVQLADRLRRSGAPVALLPEMWAQAATGACVVVGTRTAAWAPLERPRAVLVIDAHDEAYREERSPTWSAVDVVVERGRRDRSPVVLVSPCPPVSMTEGRALVVTGRTLERRGWPVVEVVDRTDDDPRTGLFSDRLARRLHGVLDGVGGRAVCILNRTGRTRLLACRQCGALARCTRCGGPVAQAAAGGHLECRRCGEARPAVCADCDSTRLKSLRMGVTRATEELSALTGVEAVEITGSSDPSRGDGARLVVGTEAALHRVHRADLVCFLDIDQHLLAPRFAAGEETLSLLARAARLVGTRETGGRVLVQTRMPGHEVLTAAVHADPQVLSDAERPLRLSLALPPFSAVATLRGAGAATFAEGLAALGTLDVSPGDGDRWVVRAPDHRSLGDALAAVPRPAGRLRIEVDPTDV
jgi:primosomal protein N' (replication factor Y) (superfamily II helicase)